MVYILNVYRQNRLDPVVYQDFLRSGTPEPAWQSQNDSAGEFGEAPMVPAL